VLSVAAITQAYADEGIAPEDLTGVEDALRADFVRARRPISGVESVTEQLGFFSGMPLRAQRAFLESLVESAESGEDTFDPGELGWLSGDVEAIGVEMAELPPDLYEPLITRRNARWTDWLIARLDRPGTLLFAVGAGHLAGRDSVQSMLAARGFRAARLNSEP
ncbi:MAG: TraB/GumN family protein, partial [Allosphingosinicella sp.]